MEVVKVKIPKSGSERSFLIKISCEPFGGKGSWMRRRMSLTDSTTSIL